MGFHQLIAALKLIVDPTRHIDQAGWGQTAAIPKPAIHGAASLFLKCSTTLYIIYRDIVGGGWGGKISPPMSAIVTATMLPLPLDRENRG
jgi:hypothetical protein